MNKMEELVENEVVRGKCFENHIATRTEYAPGVCAIDWRNKNGSVGHYVRFLFDDIGGIITISGDLGYAVVRPTWCATPEETVKYIGNTHYFIEKIATASDIWKYDEDAARAELKEYIEYEGYEDVPEDDLDEDYNEESEYSEEAFNFAKTLHDYDFEDVDDLVERVLENYSSDCGLTEIDREAERCFSDLGVELWEIASDLGKHPSVRVGLWAKALEMAMSQLEH